jgi:hypothetical protein
MPPARTIALAGLLVFAGLVLLAHPLRTDLPPTRHFVSEYARGWTAPLQIVAFLGWAAACAACTRLALRAAPPGRRVARGLATLALLAATGGALLLAVFPTETVGGEIPVGVTRTPGGRLHDFGSLLVFAGLVLAALASVRLVRRRGYRLTVLALGIALLLVVPVLVALELDAPGIGQRGFILVGLVWQWRFARAA